MRRGPLKRRKGPKGTKGRGRTPKERERDVRRTDERFERQFHSATYIHFTQACSCVACGRKASAYSPNECSHHPSRGAGGGYQDISPLCPFCHREYHQAGQETFQRRHDIDLKAENARHWKAFQEWGEVWP